MTDTVDAHFIKDYADDVHLSFQNQGSLLLPAVRHKSNVIGESTTFHKMAKGTAQTKARNADIVPMNASGAGVEVSISDFYAGDYVDVLDEIKTNADERMALADTGAMALGRKVDDQIATALDATTETTVSWTVSSQAAIRNALITMCKALDANSVPNRIGQRYGALTPTAWAMACTVDEFNNADRVGPNGLPLTTGAPNGDVWRSWNGVLWKVHSELPGVGTATAKVFVWHKMAVGYASGFPKGKSAVRGASPVVAEINYVPTKVAYLVNQYMAGGAGIIDTTGVIEGNLDDTAALPTS